MKRAPADPADRQLVDTSDASNRFNSTDLGTFGGDKLTLNLLRTPRRAPTRRGRCSRRAARLPHPAGVGHAGASPAAVTALVTSAGEHPHHHPGRDNDAIAFTIEFRCHQPPERRRTCLTDEGRPPRSTRHDAGTCRSRILASVRKRTAGAAHGADPMRADLVDEIKNWSGRHPEQAIDKRENRYPLGPRSRTHRSSSRRGRPLRGGIHVPVDWTARHLGAGGR